MSHFLHHFVPLSANYYPLMPHNGTCEEAGLLATPCGIMWYSYVEPKPSEIVDIGAQPFLPSQSRQSSHTLFTPLCVLSIHPLFSNLVVLLLFSEPPLHFSLEMKPRFKWFVVQVPSCEDDPVIPPLSSLVEPRTCVVLRNRQHTGGGILCSRLDCEQASEWLDIVQH